MLKLGGRLPACKSYAERRLAEGREAAHMIVEFTGITGSGKSVLASLGTRDLARYGHDALTKTDIVERYLRGRGGLWGLPRILPEKQRTRILQYLFRVLRSGPLQREFAERHPDAWASFLRQLEEIRQGRTADLAYAEQWTREVIAFYIALRRGVASDTLFLWEEGIGHRAINLFASTSHEVDTQALGGFLASWPFADAVVEVQADPELCLRRIKARGISPRLRGTSEEEVLAFLTTSRMVVRAIVTEAEARKTPVLRLTNDFESLNHMAASPAWARLLRDISELNGSGVSSPF